MPTQGNTFPFSSADSVKEGYAAIIRPFLDVAIMRLVFGYVKEDAASLFGRVLLEGHHELSLQRFLARCQEDPEESQKRGDNCSLRNSTGM
jgi:hypothetical protein